MTARRCATGRRRAGARPMRSAESRCLGARVGHRGRSARLASRAVATRSIVSAPRQEPRERRRCALMRDPNRNEEPYGPLRRDVRLLGSLLGAVLVDQEGEAFLAAEEPVRASGAASREIGDPSIVRDAVRELSARRAGDGCCGRSESTSSSRTPPSSTIGSGAGARTPPRTGAPRESLEERFERLAAIVPGEELRAPARATSRSSSSSPPTRPRRRGERCSARTCGSPSCSPATTTRSLSAGGAGRARGGARRGDHDPLADRRGARRPAPRRSTRSGTGSGSSSRACSTPASGCCADYRAPAPGRRAAVPVRKLDRRRPRRQPRRSAARRSLLALERARESALARYRADVRRLAIAIASSRSLVDVSPELVESIARDERECTAATATRSSR